MTKSQIPLLDLNPEIEQLWTELNEAVQGVIRSGQFIMGPNVKLFEQEMAAYLGVKHTIACNSGTDALLIGLRALGIGPGEEVITTPFTFFATSEGIDLVGAQPVFVDIDPETYNLDLDEVARAITPKTRAIIPVHLFGRPCAMAPLMELARANNLLVLEDVAQALGAQYQGSKLGTIGHAGAFSFFPSKNLGAYGDGGMLVTNDDEVADNARMLRVHGSRKKYHNETFGYNSRLDEMQAAILRVKFPHLDEWNSGRRKVAARYDEMLRGFGDISLPSISPDEDHVFHQYTIRVHNDKRDLLQERLSDLGVATMVYYPVPLHHLPVYRRLELSLPHAELATQEVLSLPIWPQMSDDIHADVVSRISEALG